jgi:predicted amidohydrolase YtcJ
MARTLVTAAHVLAGDPPREGPTAFVVENGTITWVGDGSKRPRGRIDQKIELGEAWVMPGFVDPHFHLSGYAVLPGWVDVSGVRTVADLAGKLREGAGGPRRAPGSWGGDSGS